MEPGGYNPFKRAAEYGPDRETARERMFESLERKVKAVKILRERLDSFTPESAPQEVEAVLMAFLEETKASFPEETLKRAEEARRLGAEIKEAENAEADDDVAEAERIDRLRDRVAMIESNDDVRFINDWDGLTRSLVAKNRTVHDLGQDSAKAVAQFAANEGQPIAADQVERVIFNAFDVGFVLKPEAYNAMEGTESTLGLYSGGTPFYAALAGRKPTEIENTIRHERTHNIVDGVREIARSTWYPSKRLLSFERLEQLNAPQILIDQVRERLFFRGPQQIIDGQQDEILAELERAEAKGFVSRGGKKHEFDLIFGGASRRFEDAAGAFATAGNEMVFARDFYRNLAKRKGEEDLSERARNMADGVEREFLRVVDNLKTSMAAGKRLGQEAWGEIHALAALLKPSRYRHIRRYLDHKYSKETVEKALRIDALMTGYPTAEALHLAVSDDGMVTEDDRKAMAERLRDFDFSDFDLLRIDSFDEGLAFAKDLERLFELAGAPSDLRESGFWGHLSYFVLQRDLGAGFAGVPDMLARLPTEQKDHFLETFIDYLGDFFLEDLDMLGLYEFDPDDPSSCVKLPHWDVVVKLGLEERAREKMGI